MSDLAHNAALPATEVQIQFRQVVKDFGRNRVIDHLDLSIPQGQKVALIGPSGSGKSTVLRLIKGLESYQLKWPAKRFRLKPHAGAGPARARPR